MTSFRNLSLTLLSSAALLLAQNPQTGGWRRATDPPPAPVEQNQPAGPVVMDQDPTQPVARAGAYGQPQQDVQQAPQMRPPAAMPHYGLPAQVTLRPGSFVTVRVDQEISSDANQQGDLFHASLAQPLVVDGVVVAQRGQPVIGRVAEAVKAGRAAGTSHLALQLTGITLSDGTQAAVQSQMVNRNGQTSVGNDVGAVATTTGVGAAIGAAADWGRGAAIGAAAGAAAGIVGVLLTRGHPTIVYPETLLTFRVDNPITVDLTRAPQAFRFIGPDEYDRPMQTTNVQRRPPPPPYGPAPYGGPYYGGPAYYPYYPYSYWGPGVSVGVVVGHGYGYGYGYGGYRRWR